MADERRLRLPYLCPRLFRQERQVEPQLSAPVNQSSNGHRQLLVQDESTWPLAESNDATQNVMTESTVKPLSGVMPLSCNN